MRHFMSVPRHRDIRVGTSVSIVLKADQRTGRQVQGTVAQLLTRGDHPRGVKVRLVDGRIGRVQQLASTTSQYPSPVLQHQSLRMNPEHNPWQSSTSQGNPYMDQQAENFSRQYNQPAQQGQTGQSYPGSTLQGYNQDNQTPAPAQRVNRSDTERLLAQQSDGAEQLEHMQNYEASARQTEDDKNQAQLVKEFPGVDSSLIAALYNDTKDLGATREMLQELARS